MDIKTVSFITAAEQTIFLCGIIIYALMESGFQVKELPLAVQVFGRKNNADKVEQLIHAQGIQPETGIALLAQNSQHLVRTFKTADPAGGFSIRAGFTSAAGFSCGCYFCRLQSRRRRAGNQTETEPSCSSQRFPHEA